jgi:AcrR family transcriptional regulator
MGTVETAAPKRGTRPRNRRALIIDAAARLFVRDGYPQVSINDIATAVAITPPALYRHFRSKEELLYETVAADFLAVREGLEESRSWAELVEWLAGVVLAHRGIGILWQRESRHLDPERRNELRVQLVEVERVVAAQLRNHRTVLSDREVDLLAWSTLTAAMSISFQRVELPHDDYVRLLADVVHNVTETDLPPGTDGESPRSTGPSLQSEATADRLAQAALELFAERGFKSVGINDVAAAVGIAGPSAYSHFESKVALLTAAMGDGARILFSEKDEILAQGLPPEETLARLLRSYVDFSFPNHHLVDLMLSETSSLEPDARATGLQAQRDYLRTWVEVLQELRPDLPDGHARVRVQAVITLTNDIARTAHLRTQSGVREATIAVAASILGLGQRPRQ